MKKTKLYAKKTLSVVMAVLMLMSAWVFVAPAEAGAVAASTIESTNLNALNNLTGTTTITANQKASFPHDSAGNDGSKAFKNVLYTTNYTNSNRFSGVVNISVEYDKNWAGNRSSAVISYHYSPAVLMYDGSTTPSIGILMTHDGNKTGGTSTFSSTTNGSWLANTDGLVINEFWRGQCGGNMDFAWAINQGYAADYRPGKYDYYFTTDSKSSSEPSTANLIKFTGSLDNNTYSKTLYPIFHYYGSGSSGGERNAEATGTQPIYVVNVVPLKTAFANYEKVKAEVTSNPAKYTPESVAKFVEVANALLAQNPNNYDWKSDTGTQVKNYADNTPKAISAWSTWYNTHGGSQGGLEFQKYDVKFVNKDGAVVGTYSYNYGTSVNLTSLANGHTNSKITDAKQHELFKWDHSLGTVTLTDDITINEVSLGKVEHTWAAYNQNHSSGEHSRTCSVCGYVEIEAHAKNNGTVTKNENCEEDGEKRYDCLICGKLGISTEVIDKWGHDFSAQVPEAKYFAKAATCTSGATYYYSCSHCGLAGTATFTYGNPSDHTLTTIDETTRESTCTVPGSLKRTTYCSACNLIDHIDIITLPLADHTEATREEVKVPATCGKDGTYDLVTYCSVCQKELNREKGLVIPATGNHQNLVVIPAVEATCTETGLTVGQKCEDCGTITVEQQVVSMKPHTEEVVPGKEATCSATGLTAGKKCSVCGTVLLKQEEIPMLPHTEVSTTTREEPTCGKAGYEGTIVTCSVCGKEIRRDGKVLPATGNHTYKDVVTAPTCTEDGYTTHTCTVCEHSYKDSSVPKLGHAYAGVDTAPTCTDKGYTTYTCSRCGHSYVGNYVDALGHKYGAVVTDPTCTDKGYTTYTCSVCGHSYVDNYVDALGHNYKAEVTDPTCTDRGFTTHTCSVCKDSYVDTYVPALGHEYDVREVAPTCTEDGHVLYDCIRCDDSYKIVNEGTATGHEEYTLIDTVASTCTEQGYKLYKCPKCGHEKKEMLDLEPHNMTKTEGIAPKCDVPGQIEYYTCSKCGLKYDDEIGTNVVTDIVIPALEHTWTGHTKYDILVSESTCMLPAVYKKYCSYCGEVELEGTYEYGRKDESKHVFEGEIRQNGDGTHSYKCTAIGCGEFGGTEPCAPAADAVAKSETVATCKTPGYIVYECEICKADVGEKATDPDPDNHEGKIELRNVIEATCSTKGYSGDEYYSCCDVRVKEGTETDYNSANHEELKEYPGKEATCQAAGSTGYTKCEKCDVITVASEPIAQKEHVFTTYVSDGKGKHYAICDTCADGTEKATTESVACSGGKANCVDKAVCDVCGSAYGEVDSTNHKSHTRKVKVEPTCQTEGTEPYNYCMACGVTTSEVKKIAKLDHTWGTWSKVDGENKHIRSCVTCDPTVGEVATEKADCNGGVAYCNKLAECADCKAEYGTFNAANHISEANTLRNVVEATCQSKGYSGDYYYDCCYDETEGADNTKALKKLGEETDKLEHKYDIEVEGSRKDATCIATGEVTYMCSTCDAERGEVAEPKTVTIPKNAKNHASSETRTENVKAATCLEDGYTGDIYYACCYNEAEGADNSKALKQAGTVIKAGGQHVYTKEVPEYMIQEIKETKDADGKVISREIVLKTSEPDYEAKVGARHADGNWYHTKMCTLCYEIKTEACYTYNHTYSCSATDICAVCAGLCSLKDLDNHAELKEHAKVEADHLNDGTKAYYECEACGKFFLDDGGKKEFNPNSDEGKALITISKDTVPCTDWVEDKDAYEAPTCGKDGKRVYRCTVEGCTKVKTEVVPATAADHSWNKDYTVIKEPTCHSVGYKAIYCAECETVKPNSTVTLAATGEHIYGEPEKIPGKSCKEPGKLIYTCTNAGCTNTKEETDTEGTSAHNWGEWVAKGGDCSTGILQERTCSVCQATETQTISAGTHEEIEVLRVEATKEKDGYVIYKCSKCGNERKLTLTFEDEKHTYDENIYIVHKEATCTHGEIRRYTCLTCGEIIEKEVGNPAPHLWLLQAEEAATCSKDGHSAYEKCALCDAEKGKTVYKKLGHDDKDGNGKCDRCNESYYNDGTGTKTCNCICHKDNFFMKIIYKIVSFFWKLFKIGHSCDCGAVHY